MYFSRTFKALNFDFQIQGLSRTFKVRANPDKTISKPSFNEFPPQTSNLRVCLCFCRDCCAVLLTVFESISMYFI